MFDFWHVAPDRGVTNFRQLIAIVAHCVIGVVMDRQVSAAGFFWFEVSPGGKTPFALYNKRFRFNIMQDFAGDRVRGGDNQYCPSTTLPVVL
ncbi:MAG: hypothetical protein KAJ73_04345 [Zetaproteobacteria bacterium]|nr:hypothetical protein [Zetaproteobacteria bacterium]